MTETEWGACLEVNTLLDVVRVGKLSSRKVWLFIAAIGRSCWFISADEPFNRVVTLAERHADGLAREGELEDEVFQVGYHRALAGHALGWDAAAWAFSGKDIDWMTDLALRISNAMGTAPLSPCYYLRDIFGPLLFRSPPFDSRWQTQLVLSLAEAAYEERIAPDATNPGWLVVDPVRLKVLADALEEADCTNAELLSHCRQPGVHVRGCWVVDLLLGKE